MDKAEAAKAEVLKLPSDDKTNLSEKRTIPTPISWTQFRLERAIG